MKPETKMIAEYDIITIITVSNSERGSKVWIKMATYWA